VAFNGNSFVPVLQATSSMNYSLSLDLLYPQVGGIFYSRALLSSKYCLYNCIVKIIIKLLGERLQAVIIPLVH
jgi:hypothetical protein